MFFLFRHGNRLQIKHLPGQVSKEDIVPLISAFGNVLNVDIGICYTSVLSRNKEVIE